MSGDVWPDRGPVDRDPAPPAPRRSPRPIWLACCVGVEPAESLDWRDREDLVVDLVGRGWTDVQIAEHTKMSTYTTARIRERLELPPNVPVDEFRLVGVA